MRCLSICQPFAELIISGKKTIELRRWNTRFRGEFLIHAAKKIRVKDCERLGMNQDLVTGAIVGRAEIYDVKIYDTSDQVNNDSNLHHSDMSNGKYGFMLRQPKRFATAIPWKGRLGFFDVTVKPEIDDSTILQEIIDEDYRYQWVGHH